MRPSIAAFLVLAAVLCCGFVLRGGSGTAPVTNPSVLTPLSGQSLVTANSGTLTFANWQTEKGWELQSNASDIYVPALSVCNAAVSAGVLTCTSSGTGTAAYALYNSQLTGATWPTTQCLVDGYTVQTTLTAPTGTFTTPDGAAWTWGSALGSGNYQVNRNGVTLFRGSQLLQMTDGSVFAYAADNNAWYVYVPSAGAFLGWGTAPPTAQPATTALGGKWRKAVTCPSGLNQATYVAPCDLVTGGCAAAYSPARALTNTYNGNLFRLVRTSNGTTLDVGQTANRTWNSSTWSAFCGGVQANCVVDRIYDHSGNGNTLVAAVFNGPFGPDCTGGTFYKCACPFVINATTGYPEMIQASTCEYALAGDAAGAGLNAGTGSMTVALNATPVQQPTACCAMFLRSHLYSDVPQIAGTDFGIDFTYGNSHPGWAVGAGNFSINTELEGGGGVQYDYSRVVMNTLVVATADSSATPILSLFINNNIGFSGPIFAAPSLSAGQRIHLFGGGDLSQTGGASGTFREGIITNKDWQPADVKAFVDNEKAFYSAISFPDPTVLVHAP